MFVRNTWYVAGYGHELQAGQLLARTILGEGVVLYRQGDGLARALADRCPHRSVPLHVGKVQGDRVQCGYHGLEFGPDGRCEHNPHGDGRISSNMAVRSYPLVERDGLLWIWPGDAERADPSSIHCLGELVDTAFKPVFGYMRVDANYQLINDNLLDLSHTQYVHPLFMVGDPLPDALPPVIDAGCDERSVWFKQTLRNIPPHPYAALFDERPRVDNWINTHWYPPSTIRLDIGTRAPGSDSGEGDVKTPTFHLLTPANDTSTHYWWMALRNVKLEDEGLSQAVYHGTDAAFTYEDKPIIEMQQRELAGRDEMSVRPVLLQTDATAVRARRIVQRLIDEERSLAESSAA